MINTKLPSKMKMKMQFKTQAVKDKQTKPLVDHFSDTWESKSKAPAPQADKRLDWYSIF